MTSAPDLANLIQPQHSARDKFAAPMHVVDRDLVTPGRANDRVGDAEPVVMVSIRLQGLVRSPTPLPYLLRALPEPIAVILGGIGDGVDGFGTRLRQR